MKIAVGIPVYNEEIFIEQSVQNCIAVGYDYVVYLDDGSTDNSYEKLLNCTKDYPHIKIIRNENNSVLSNNGNRWEIVSEECRKFDPDWIMVRATDECLSYPAFKNGPNLLRKNIEYLKSKGVNSLVFSYIDLWRSPYWYRTDGFWGIQRSSRNCWLNTPGWKIDSGSGIHGGRHHPFKFGYKEVISNINFNDSGLVVLHYGMSSHELLERKFQYQIETSIKIKNRATGVPQKIPHPSSWKSVNGLKVADERNIQFEKVKQIWYKEQIPDVPKPEIRSLYNIILKYDSRIAEEYAKIYGR
jgi:glycosyltransferase involved in cell wall biosynthesis